MPIFISAIYHRLWSLYVLVVFFYKCWIYYFIHKFQLPRLSKVEFCESINSRQCCIYPVTSETNSHSPFKISYAALSLMLIYYTHRYISKIACLSFEYGNFSNRSIIYVYRLTLVIIITFANIQSLNLVRATWMFKFHAPLITRFI